MPRLADHLLQVLLQRLVHPLLADLLDHEQERQVRRRPLGQRVHDRRLEGQEHLGPQELVLQQEHAQRVLL